MTVTYTKLEIFVVVGVLGVLAGGIMFFFSDVTCIGTRKPPEVATLKFIQITLAMYTTEQGNLPYAKSTTGDLLITAETSPSLADLLALAEPKTGSPQLPADSDLSGIRLVLDTDCNGVLDGNLINGSADLETEYACWWIGPDGKEESPYTNEMKGHNQDNVTTWRRSQTNP